MDKSILKKFAIESRQDLMGKISAKIKSYYIDEEFSKEQKSDVYILNNNNHTLKLTIDEYRKRELLIKRINDLSLEQVIEEASYTWFNRIVAIRYMEINDMLPLTKNNESLGIKVLSSKDNTPDPEILKFTNLNNPDLDIEFNKNKYSELKEEDKFKYVLLLVCKKLGRVIPQVFNGITDYIDILIPDNLLNDTGFITKIVKEVPLDNYNEVEIIGWLYQYYNQTEKDRVISAKKTYKKTEIPYATQLFTPDWIVKYMVENSLGRYWVEHNNDKRIIENWNYFIKDNLDIKNEKISPTEITFIDPCCGSGHILVYAFEVLYQIYESVGYNKLEIPKLILKNNIYGLDIDDRAGQLSILSVLLKAREYDKNIFNKNIASNLNVMSLQESKNIMDHAVNNLPNTLKEKVNYLKNTFDNAKEIGSLLLVENNDYTDVLTHINKELTIETANLQDTLPNLIKQAKILSQKYDVVVTNPPYLNNNVMSDKMKNYLILHYKDIKSDLFSAFIIRDSHFGKNTAYLGYMTPNVWMFISSYEKLREYIMNNLSINSLIHLAKGSFFKEATVDICTFILNNNNINREGIYIRLEKFKGDMTVQEQKTLETIKNSNTEYIYVKDSKEFNKIPGNPIAYWVSKKIYDIYSSSKSLSTFTKPKQGTSTGDNNIFLRFWYEVNNYNICFSNKYNSNLNKYTCKWYPATKGGNYKKYYGNNEYIIDWENNGENIKNYNGSAIRNKEIIFSEALTWTGISSSNFGVRYCPEGFVFTISGKPIIGNSELLKYILGFLCSKLSSFILNMTNPTLSFEVGYICALPLIYKENIKCLVDNIVDNNISISKYDWDSFETSWDFKSHPLLEFKSSMPGLADTKNILNIIPANIKINKNIYGEDTFIADNIPLNSKIEDAFNNWEKYCEKQFNQLKQNEEELNKIFIEIYGLQDELTPEVKEKDVTIRKADEVRDIKSLISYAVGCIFGRYSIYKKGLIYAGGEFNIDNYVELGMKYLDNLFANSNEECIVDKFFTPDLDNIIPITDEAYFSDDIVSRFKKFIEVVYGESTLNENLDFIAETIGKRGTETSEETIRRYFNNEFYNDHIKTYQKKPIYWLFDSGKKNGFKCLVYMHRYNEGLVAKVRLDYLHRIQTTYEKLLNDVNYKLGTELSLNDKKEALKRQIELTNKLQEIKEYDEKISHMANQRINIDLDDGVTANYEKFSDILAKIK